MKKILLLLVFLALTYSSFAQNAPGGSIFFEGTAHWESLVPLFYQRFTDEATAAGYTVAESQSEAAHTFRYIISGSSQVTGDNEPTIRIIITNNSDMEEILDFEYLFIDINEMYEYAYFLFQRATIYIPLPRKSDFIDVGWQNKLLYIRASFDYPITFYALQPDGLVGGGIAVYATDDDGNIIRVSPEDNKVLAMPGATIGLEFQFLSFVSLELNLQANMGDTRNNNFVNLAAGAELKFPLKFFQHIVIEPYLTLAYPLTVSEIFSEFPLFMVGGGLQVGTKGGKNGSFFIDVGFRYSTTKAAMHNPYREPPLFPEPSVIYYNHYLLKLGVGYKFGIIDRKDGDNLLIRYY